MTVAATLSRDNNHTALNGMLSQYIAGKAAGVMGLAAGNASSVPIYMRR